MADKPNKKNKKEEIKFLTLKNHHIQIIAQWLGEMKLSGSDTRIRNRFFTIIGNRLNEIDSTRKEIVDKHAEKKDGKVLTEKKPVVDGTGDTAKLQDVPVFKDGNDKKADEEYSEVLQEEFVIDILPSTKETILKTGQLLLNTDRTFDLNDGKVYDYICTKFEEL